ncbi:folylpolyglutamate synthase [Coemansia interrupta]|uniref:Folylpolyglutamate synthase n=1 Tax=Coemansia interrupta TaxID=1126814 RepID=A0A9W8HR51_9FUNG|nr:folylpolyglutamate synthase [Coemansia interrupta]
MTVSDSTGRIKLGLERIINFFEHVLPSDPRAKLRIVHVAGTNGKGSVCALISEALIAGGYKVGTFNSPHFLEVNDAVRIQGVPIPMSEYTELRSWISSLDAKAQAPCGPLTLFEQATVATVWWFAQNDVDLAVIEVGMGGLRDATNVFGTADGRSSLGVGRSLVQCICPVDADHLGMIGNTIEEIAHEKAGIMRPGSWVVIGSQDHVEAFHKIRQIAHRISPGRIVNVRRQPSYDLHVPKFAIKHADKEAELTAQITDAQRFGLPSWASFNGTGRRCLRVKYPPTLEIYKVGHAYCSHTGDHRPPLQPQPQKQQTPPHECVKGMIPTVELDLPLVLAGYYQAGNASIAFYALDVLRTHFGFTKLTDAVIQTGFQNVRWPGRLSWLRFGSDGMGMSTPHSHGSGSSSDTNSASNGISSTRSSTRSNSVSGRSSFDESDLLGNWILADGAHNEPAAVELRKYVDTTLRRVTQQRYIHATRGRDYQNTPNVRWIVGFSGGKDMKGILNNLALPGDLIWAVPFSQPDEMPWISCTGTDEIEAAAREIESSDKVLVTKFASLADALARLSEEKSDSNMTVLCGSLYLVADLYRELQVDPFNHPRS